jgi:hypothetical protein
MHFWQPARVVLLDNISVACLNFLDEVAIGALLVENKEAAVLLALHVDALHVVHLDLVVVGEHDGVHADLTFD